MKKLKRILRRAAIITLMLMAAVAVGITGAAPVIPRNRERHIVIEVVVDKEEEKTPEAWSEQHFEE